MKLPPRVIRADSSCPVDALLLRKTDVGALLALCARLTLDPTQRVFPIDRGYLIKLPTPLARTPLGTIGLRSVSDNVLIPQNSELIPSLYPEEAEGLARGEGLIFTPWGQILEFEPREPLDLSRLIVATRRECPAWSALPPVPPLAETLHETLLALPKEPDPWMEPRGGVPDVPEETSTSRRWLAETANRTREEFGRFLMGIGRKLGSAFMTAFGQARMIRSLRQGQITPALLNRHEALLESLLREFREGNRERALKKAIPIGDEPSSRPPVFANIFRLASHAFRYSLDSLTGAGSTSNRGWALFGSNDTLSRLQYEYRESARLAMEQGDFRRAAMIFGRLLKDYYSAANCLAKGGLHHDAALVFLNRLKDKVSAAREFEAAGEWDRAVQLHRELGAFEAAGDVLTRAGDPDAALAEYERAARQLVTSGPGHLAAGRLLANKASRDDLALQYYLQGWSNWPESSAVSCLIAALELHTHDGAVDAITSRLAEVDATRVHSPQVEPEWTTYFQAMTRISEHESIHALRDELRDRARMGLGAQLRHRSGTIASSNLAVSTLFGQSGAWTTSIVEDAAFAARAYGRSALNASSNVSDDPFFEAIALESGLRQDHRSALESSLTRELAGPAETPINVLNALGFASETGELMVASSQKGINCFNSRTNEWYPVFPEMRNVRELTISHDGSIFVTIERNENAGATLRVFQRTTPTTFKQHSTNGVPWKEGAHLGSIYIFNKEYRFYYFDGSSLHSYHPTYLLSDHKLRVDGLPSELGRGIPLVSHSRHWMLAPIEDSWALVDLISKQMTRLGSAYSTPRGLSGDQGPGLISSIHAGMQAFQTLHLGQAGEVVWHSWHIDSESGTMEQQSRRVRESESGPYLAATLIRPARAIALTATRIEWIRMVTQKTMLQGAKPIHCPRAVACFHEPSNDQVILVNQDATVERIDAAI